MTLSLFGDAKSAAIDALHVATAVYTVSDVVDRLLDQLDWPRAGRRLVDPSCGDGVFLECALRRLLGDHAEHISDHQIVDTLEGWEVHPFAADEARRRVTRVIMEYGRSRDQAVAIANAIVHNKDFLTEGPDSPQFHVAATNPPYLIWMRVPSPLREEYDEVVPGYARLDLLYSFLDRCARCLHKDGEIGFVSADRWLFNAGARSLRASLGDRGLSIAHLERLDASTAFYRPKSRRTGTPARVHPVAVVMRIGDGPIQLNGDPIYPDDLSPQVAGGQMLDDVAEVRIAPWLGTPGIFVVDKETARRLPPEHLVPAMDTDDIVDGRMKPPTRYAIRTTPGVEPPPEIVAHLSANMHRMCKRGLKAGPWLPPERFHKVDLSQPCLLVPRIAKTLRPIRVPAGVLPINHNLSIVSAGDLDLDTVEAVLSSDAAAQWVWARAARLENQYYSLTTTLLRQLPVPPEYLKEAA